MYLLGNFKSNKKIAEYLETDLRGELTVY
jgi:hypothetical protein